MASLGSFGVAKGVGDPDYQQTRTRTQSAEVTPLINNLGVKIEGTSHGSEIRVSEEHFAGATLPLDAALTAVDAQNGTDIVISHAVKESATDYAKISTEKVIYPGAGA